MTNSDTRPTEQGETGSPLEVAVKIAIDFRDALGHDRAAIDRLSDAIEAALKDRDERAAKIAETAFKEFQTGYNAGKWIAEAIRKDQG